MTGERWRRVEALYHQALALDARERPAFLREACAADEALRREVESLLAYEQAGAATPGSSRRCRWLPRNWRANRRH